MWTVDNNLVRSHSYRKLFLDIIIVKGGSERYTQLNAEHLTIADDDVTFLRCTVCMLLRTPAVSFFVSVLLIDLVFSHMLRYTVVWYLC